MATPGKEKGSAMLITHLAEVCATVERDTVQAALHTFKHGTELAERLAELRTMLANVWDKTATCAHPGLETGCQELLQCLNFTQGAFNSLDKGDTFDEEDLEVTLKSTIQATSRLFMIILVWLAHDKVGEWAAPDTQSTMPTSSHWDDERLFGKKKRRGRNVEDGWWPDDEPPTSIHDISEMLVDTEEPMSLESKGPRTMPMKNKKEAKDTSLASPCTPPRTAQARMQRLQFAEVDSMHCSLKSERKQLLHPPKTPELISPSRADRLWFSSQSRAKIWREGLNLTLHTGAESDEPPPPPSQPPPGSTALPESPVTPTNEHESSPEPFHLLSPLANLVISEHAARKRFDKSGGCESAAGGGEGCSPWSTSGTPGGLFSSDASPERPIRRKAHPRPARGGGDGPTSAPHRSKGTASSAPGSSGPSSAPEHSQAKAAVPGARPAWHPPSTGSESDDELSEGGGGEDWPYGESPLTAAEGGERAAACKAFAMAERYFYGSDGVTKDYNVALKKYIIAASKGHPSACNRIGMCCQYGLGTEIDYTSSVEWYREALSAGVLDAANNLGCFHSEVVRDYEMAAEYFYRAAKKGLSDAQTNLGHLYEHGLGVEQDERQAARWYSKASAQGNPKALNNMGLVHYRRGGYDKAVACFAASAQRGYSTAMNNLGICYEEGQGVPRDLHKAKMMYKEAADRGNSSAKNNLGFLLLSSDKEEDFVAARQLCHEAAREGVADGWLNLGALFEQGLGVAVDLDKAISYYIRAADRGSVKAQLRVGKLLLEGAGGREPDPTAAAYYFHMGASTEEPECTLELAKLFEEGVAVPLDESTARDLYNRAAQLSDDGEAMYRLALMLREGRGGPVDNAAADKLFEEAAFAGYDASVHKK